MTLTARAGTNSSPRAGAPGREESPRTLDELIEALQGLHDQPSLERARNAKLLIDAGKSVLSGVRREAIYQAVEGPLKMLRVDVADALGVGKSAVTKAVEAHRASVSAARQVER